MDINNIKASADIGKIKSFTENSYKQESLTKKAELKNSSQNQSVKNIEKTSSREEVEKITKEINLYMDELKTSLGFSIDEKTKELMVNIINRETKKVIKQIPPEELVAIREKMAELTGILFSRKV